MNNDHSRQNRGLNDRSRQREYEYGHDHPSHNHDHKHSKTQPQIQQIKREYILSPLQTPHDILTVKELFRSYAASLNIDLTFQNFEDEIRNLPGVYGRPEGEVLIAWEVDPLPSSSCSCVENDGGNEREGRTNELKEVGDECGTDGLNQYSEFDECGEFVHRKDGDGVVNVMLDKSERWKRDGRAVAVGCVALRPLHSTSRSSALTTAVTSADVDDKVVDIPASVLNSCSISPSITSSQLIKSGPQATKTAELKRLYVDPAHRSSGVGKILMSEIIKVARERGYDEIKLDTIPTMIAAQKMYESLGFRDVDGYCFNPVAGVRFMGLDLRTS